MRVRATRPLLVPEGETNRRFVRKKVREGARFVSRPLRGTVARTCTTEGVARTCTRRGRTYVRTCVRGTEAVTSTCPKGSYKSSYKAVTSHPLRLRTNRSAQIVDLFPLRGREGDEICNTFFRTNRRFVRRGRHVRTCARTWLPRRGRKHNTEGARCCADAHVLDLYATLLGKTRKPCKPVLQKTRLTKPII